MKPKNFVYYPKRLWQLGITGIMQQAVSRIRKKWFSLKFRNFTGHQWSQIAKNHCLPSNFTDFFRKQTDNDFIEKIRILPGFIQNLSPEYQNKEFILEQANNSCENCFDIFGSGKVCFEEHKIPWTSDYYTDIKIPWELSRFQHLYFLGHSIQFASNQDSSQTTLDERQNSIKLSKYVHMFQAHVSGWLKKNRFLVGVNWVNPMEVAIRAINLIWAFSFFKDCPEISSEFWEKLVCSLYDHMIYIENNWEVSDKPNNHYISDLVGHFYLCSFFNFNKRKQKTLKHILEQFNHQILPDGTSYEGSTSYHKLDTELFWHVALLCQAQNIELPNSFHEKLKLMFNFLRACSVGNELVQIGDNDSGKVVMGISSQAMIPVITPLRHYPDFGLSIIKNKRWHITFRHATYKKNQPTGHFHNDQLAITVAIDGIPILVDPGSYLYTASEKWRNRMRSFQSHNTFYTQDEIENEFGQDLFQLDREKSISKPEISETQNKIEIKSSYRERSRKILFCPKTEYLTVTDHISSSGEKYIWNLLFHPELELEKVDISRWIIRHAGLGKNFILNSQLTLQKETGYFSPSYGKVETCTKLVSQKKKIPDCCLSFSFCVK